MKSALAAITAFLVGMLLVGLYVLLFTKPVTKPTPVPEFSLDNPPNQSLRGTIVSFSGRVSWQSRTATEPAQLTTPVPVKQGERIQTDETGSASVLWNDAVTMDISPKSDVLFAQTLTGHLVFSQSRGIVRYRLIAETPVSVRSGPLLIKIISGESVVSMDEKQGNILVQVVRGSMKAAFNDKANVSRLVSVSAARQLIFYTTTRTAVVRLL